MQLSTKKAVGVGKTTVDYIIRVVNSSSNGINAKYIIYQLFYYIF
ncbi:hypothetical protein [Campylobacter devanensis]|nr:hypothetical protein [Campylobacter sp. P0227]